MKKLISIVGPMYNEEALVSQFCQEVLSSLQPLMSHYDLEIVLVDDGSTDNTLEQMYSTRNRYPQHVTLVQLTRNFGLEGAIHAGIRVAAGDAVVVMDADLQDPPKVVLEMVKQWENGADVVVGSRAGRPSDSFFKRFTAKCFYQALDVLSGKLRLEKEAANFRLLDRNALNALLDLPEVNGVFRVVVPFLGMKTAVVYYERDKRFSGATKFRLKSMIRYALDSLTGISIEPLRKIPGVFLFSSILTVIFAISIFFAQSEWKPALLVCTVVSVMFSLLFLVLSVMAEYLGQTYIEVKKRPTSMIYKSIRSESSLNKVAQ
jgi:dolichol-phosphate mannosyltransferase